MFLRHLRVAVLAHGSSLVNPAMHDRSGPHLRRRDPPRQSLACDRYLVVALSGQVHERGLPVQRRPPRLPWMTATLTVDAW